jgi:hypothetical protein
MNAFKIPIEISLGARPTRGGASGLSRATVYRQRRNSAAKQNDHCAERASSDASQVDKQIRGRTFPGAYEW